MKKILLNDMNNSTLTSAEATLLDYATILTQVQQSIK